MPVDTSVTSASLCDRAASLPVLCRASRFPVSDAAALAVGQWPEPAKVPPGVRRTAGLARGPPRGRAVGALGIVNLVRGKARVLRPRYGSELHAAVWTQVSCRQTRKASARARRYRAAVIKCRHGRKWP